MDGEVVMLDGTVATLHDDVAAWMMMLLVDGDGVGVDGSGRDLGHGD